ncbi:hypothetical protein [Xanthomonas albilineans]|uniref:hypothetical protein n=1 Tax=Xanthomonas albilineans TaxID=29447 RepID=UPI0005F35B5B|nr:hypothetical protein [Xanthomonas albilineans]
MFQLDDATAKVANFNPRAEKHGDDNVTAGDIKIVTTVSNGVLDHFSKHLRTALYRKALKGEQQDLIEGGDALVAVKFPRIGAIAWDEEFPGYEIEIGGGLGLAEPLVLVDVTLKKFRFEPLEGGSVAVTFSAICHPDAEEAGQLCQLIQNDVQLTVRPPTKPAQQPEPDVGDTLDQQDAADADAEAQRLIEAGRQAA